MKRRYLNLAVLAVMVLGMVSSLLAQEATMNATDAYAVLQAAWYASGYAKVKTIQYSGSGMIAAPGQAYSASEDLPRFEAPRYTRTIDFDAMSSHEDYSLRQGVYPPHGGGGTPLIGDHPRETFLEGDYAWDSIGGKVVPRMSGHLYGSPEIDFRKLEIILTPIGFLKAALAPGANPTMITFELGTPLVGPDLMNGPVHLVSFTALGKYRVVGVVNKKNQVELIDSWIANPLYGDMNIEYRYLNYKDFDGVQYPSDLHIHQGDFRLNRGHNSMYMTLKTLKVNVSVPAVNVPEAVKTADTSVTHVTSQKLADGVWLIGGSDLNSVAVEFKDFVTVVEAPENEARSLAVMAEINKLIPNKPIRYVVNTHFHWDHAGGLRTYMAQGTTVVTSEFNKDYYDRILFNPAPSRIMPDRFSWYYPYFSGDRLLLWDLVHTEEVISDDSQILDIYPVAVPQAFSAEEVNPINNEGQRNLRAFHVLGNLVVYLPKQKILINADQYTPPAPGEPAPQADNNMKLLQTTMKQWKMDVALQVPIDGQPGTEEQFEQIVGK